MIIKVKGLDGQWWMFDKVRKVRFSTSLEEGKFPDADINLITTEMGVNQDSHIFNTIVFRDINDDEKSLIFDTFAYLLNEDGKTIEKIIGS